MNIRLSDKPDFIIPILLSECEIPLFLKDYKYVVFTGSFDTGLFELLRSLNRNSLASNFLSVNQIKKEVVRIPRGPFLYSLRNEEVEIPYDYFIDKYPVSRRKFFSFVFSGAYVERRYWHYRARGWMEYHFFKNVEDKSPEELFFYRFPEHSRKIEEFDFPICMITAYEAEAYCRWVGGRLPTELEWEKAARGTDGRLYPWGNQYKGGYCYTGDDMEFRVDSYPEGVSPFGLFNVVGNKTEFIGELASSAPNDLQDEILTRGWLNSFSELHKQGVPEYSIFCRVGCFPVAANAQPIMFRCVYPTDSPYDSIALIESD